jgi:hypothetical protein
MSEKSTFDFVLSHQSSARILFQAAIESLKFIRLSPRTP